MLAGVRKKFIIADMLSGVDLGSRSCNAFVGGCLCGHDVFDRQERREVPREHSYIASICQVREVYRKATMMAFVGVQWRTNSLYSDKDR